MDIETATTWPAGSGGLTYEADRGEAFAVITIRVKNEGDVPLRVEASDLHLLDDNDRRYTWTSLFDDRDELTGTVGANGGTLVGMQAFNVPLGTTAAKLVYDDECFPQEWPLILPTAG